MKKIILLLMFPLISNAGSFEIIGPCSSEPIFKSEIEYVVEKNVGATTVEILTDNSISFIGNEIGIHSIFDTPIGNDALEMLSDNEMRAYGWCYSVDGVEPGVYPSEVLLTSKDAHISWYFGFAHYLDGEWVAQCTKSYTVQSDFVCKDKK